MVLRNLPRELQPHNFSYLAHQFLGGGCLPFSQWSYEPEETTGSAIVVTRDAKALLNGLRSFNRISITGNPIFAEPKEALGG